MEPDYNSIGCHHHHPFFRQNRTICQQHLRKEILFTFCHLNSIHHLDGYKILFSQRSYMETKGWDVFRSLPPETDSSSEAVDEWLGTTVKILKV